MKFQIDPQTKCPKDQRLVTKKGKRGEQKEKSQSFPVRRCRERRKGRGKRTFPHGSGGEKRAEWETGQRGLLLIVAVKRRKEKKGKEGLGVRHWSKEAEE